MLFEGASEDNHVYSELVPGKAVGPVRLLSSIIVVSIAGMERFVRRLIDPRLIFAPNGLYLLLDARNM